MKNLFFLVLVMTVISCRRDNYSEKDLTTMLNSENIDSILGGINIIRQNNRVEMISVILQKPYDPRIIHKKEYYGSSVYEVKIKTVRDLTHIAPPYEISYRPDSQIVKFYLEKLK